MPNGNELNSLLSMGREFYNHVKPLQDSLFSSSSEFQKSLLLLKEKIDVLDTHLDSLLRYYDNNDDNAVLIVILGQLKYSLKTLENSYKIDVVYLPQFFKRPVSPCKPKDMDLCLNLFAGSLNALELHTERNLNHPLPSLRFPPAA